MTLNLDAYWMPYTGNRQFKRDPRIIQSAQGVWFTDSDGRQVLDGHSAFGRQASGMRDRRLQRRQSADGRARFLPAVPVWSSQSL